MVFLNKYLKEIGIDENYWLFKARKIDDRCSPDEDGFVPAEFFNLDTSLAIYIYSHLCYFREHIAKISTPSSFIYDKNGLAINQDLANKKWCKTIDKMIEGFKLMIIDVRRRN